MCNLTLVREEITYRDGGSSIFVRSDFQVACRAHSCRLYDRRVRVLQAPLYQCVCKISLPY